MRKIFASWGARRIRSRTATRCCWCPRSQADRGSGFGRCSWVYGAGGVADFGFPFLGLSWLVFSCLLLCCRRSILRFLPLGLLLLVEQRDHLPLRPDRPP